MCCKTTIRIIVQCCVPRVLQAVRSSTPAEVQQTRARMRKPAAAVRSPSQYRTRYYYFRKSYRRVAPRVCAAGKMVAWFLGMASWIARAECHTAVATRTAAGRRATRAIRYYYAYLPDANRIICKTLPGLGYRSDRKHTLPHDNNIIP